MAFKIFFKIVLILLFFISLTKCANKLKTGYNYYVEPVDSFRYLKCSYLFSGLYHLTLVILNIKNCTNDKDLVEAVYNSTKYSKIVSKQLSSIYAIKGIEIGPLWLLNVFTNIVGVYIKHPKIPQVTMNSSTHEDILKTCDYIVSKYIQDIINNNCSKESVYYNKYDKDFENSLKLYGHFRMISINCNSMENLIDYNHNYTNFKLYKLDMFNKDNILLRKLGVDSEVFRNLKNTYNIQVYFGKTGTKLYNYYHKPHKLTWNEDHLLPFKVYYTSIFDFLQIIMLRLTLKHFMYLKKQNVECIEDFTIQWLEILEEFVSLLHPGNVSYISTIKSNIEDFVRGFPRIGKSVDLNSLNTFIITLFDQLNKFLEVLCIDLQCNANTRLILNGNEQFTINKNDQRRLIKHDLNSTTTVEVFSIENTKEFIIFIKSFFNGFDFNVIRSFINYIDEISQYKLF